MTNNIKRYHALVSGRVQGVSFRYYTTLKARELDIVGWVMNRADGQVEVLAEGTQEALEQLDIFLHEGSPSTLVENVEATYEDATGDFSEFSTVYFMR